eukprot:TRINITY_DN25832_c0_g1_i1.p1 TRINITY_DN25832_c0_g1~~TRINITY_DN25832_c0_g1_i1.p1  ORF type:complete len:491 (-),score=61.27 TRINITY_DN25832_c0_g1_i1:4-1476(-)
MKRAILLVCIVCLIATTYSVRFGNNRPPANQRRFVSVVVDNLIKNYTTRMKDPVLAEIFANTLPNTLDTTVYYTDNNSSITKNHIDTFVITGDINAMWLRDSSNQVFPYIEFINQDPRLKLMISGLIQRQTFSVNTDAYANAFNYDFSTPSPMMTSDTSTKPSFLGTTINAYTLYLHERKYELDSLCAFLKLSFLYWQTTSDTTIFKEDWISAVSEVIRVIENEQESADADWNPEYIFNRLTTSPTDTLMHSQGIPGIRTGMSKSPFRPSDDAATLPFPIAANAMAVVSLRNTARQLSALGQRALSTKAENLAAAIDHGIQSYGLNTHRFWQHGKVYAYEVDGYGNAYFMDDANVPSLLSLPYLGYTTIKDKDYQSTRNFVLSGYNPYYSRGAISGAPGFIEGIGGPHVGAGYIWPMSIIMRAMTSDNDTEIETCLTWLKLSSAGTGFMHESFWKGNVGSYTRPWFAWCNSLFGELILMLAKTKPHLIFK